MVTSILGLVIFRNLQVWCRMSNAVPRHARRVVTGHDENDRAVVLWDAAVNMLQAAKPPQGVQVSLVWSTEATPAEITRGRGIADAGARFLGTQRHGSRVSVLDLPPGNCGGLHRTESLDHAFILAGEVDMEIDDGVRVALKAGDIAVQRGTRHSCMVALCVAPCVNPLNFNPTPIRERDHEPHQRDHLDASLRGE